MTGRHTCTDVCNYIEILLAAIAADNWMEKFIGISLDGAAFMVGHVSGAVMRRKQMTLCYISSLLQSSEIGLSCTG